MSAPARISVVVPVLEEAEEIRGFLDRMRAGGPHEIIVADGGSSDGTIELAREGADRVIVEPGGLALQLNRGAAAATGDVLLFPYADTRLPDGWPEAIDRVLTRSGVAGGAFRFRLAGSGLRYRLIEWGTRLRARGG
ncbi:MAG: glycosyltransferase, partial [Planctomycetota bacterium]